MKRILALSALALLSAACAAPRHGHTDCDPAVELDCKSPAKLPRVAYAKLGESFATPEGACKVIKVQDDFRVVRCVGDGSIQGCYEELLSVTDYDVRWNEPLPLEVGEGVTLSFLTPTDVVVRVPPSARRLRTPAR